MTITTEELKAMLEAEYERGKREGKKVEVIRYVYLQPPVYPVPQPPWPSYPIITYFAGGTADKAPE
jgi:hypothetical protein